MDWLTWVLLGVAALAMMFWWIWYQHTRGPARVIDRAKERPKNVDMIPPEVPGAAANIFRLQNSPMLVRATSLTEPFTQKGVLSSFDPVIRDALWVQQRHLIARLESELELPLQADLSPHFVIVTPTNQSRDFLAHAVADAEKVFATLKNVIEMADPLRLWLGRAMIVLLSNRRRFDHVAWLTGTKLKLSSEGAYFIAEERIVFIPLYMTLVTDSRRMLVQQVTRAWLHCMGGIAGGYPRWVTESLARWVEHSMGGWIEGQIGWIEDGLTHHPVRIEGTDVVQPAARTPQLASAKVHAAEQIKILLPAAWERADIDPPLLESMRDSSYRVIDWLMRSNRAGLLQFLRAFKAASSEDAAWRGALNMDAKAVLAASFAAAPPPAEPKPAALPQGVTTIDPRLLDR